MTIQLGLFKLIDPPEGQVELLRNTLKKINYPWHRLLPALHRDPDEAVVVRWLDLKQQGTGLFYGSTYEIHLSTRYTNWERNVPFVFAHEVGHLVDKATLRYEDRQELTLLIHASDETYRRDNDASFQGANHIAEHNEDWTKRDKHYYLMLNEAYADLFVATFAPSLFKYVRFTHWTSDFDSVRDITLQRTIMAFNDIQDNTHREAIEWAAGQGLIKGYDDGTFRPNEPITRGQLASILKRYEEQR